MSRSRPSLSSPWAVVFGVGLLVTAANAYYIVPASVLPVLMDRLGLAPAAASLLVSVMFGTQVVVGVPIGVVLDRVDNRRAIVAATVVLLGCYAWSYQAATSGAYLSLLVSRAVATAGTAATWTAGVNVVGRVFDDDSRATAVGALSATPAAGFALGLLTGPYVAERLGWAAIFAVYAAPVVVGCLSFLAATVSVDVSGGDGPTPRLADFRELLTGRAIWSVAGMTFLGYSLYAFITSWMPTYLAQHLGFSLTSGGLFAALFPAIGIAARGTSGAVSDRLFAHRRRPVALLSFVVSVPALGFIVLATTPLVVGLALVVAGFFVQLGMGLFYAQARELAGPNVAATGVAFATSMATLGGFTAPLAAGLLIEYTGGYTAAFAYACVAGVAGLLLAWVTPEPDVS
ncbi:MAG: nitrate/nitrite transporter [Haloarculaceae archaeon]